MAHDVFISYSSKDKPIADAICATLEQNGVRCWIAPRDIRPGADWGESILHALAGSRVFILVLSGSANASQQIKREVERAVNRGIPIIPYRIEDVMPAESLEYFLSTPHWLDAFTPPVERHAQFLADTVKKILSGAPDDPIATAPESPAPQPTRRRPPWLAPLLKPVPIGVFLVSLLVLAGLGAYALRPPSFVGRWQAISFAWPAGASSFFDSISLGEIFGPTMFGTGEKDSFSVSSANRYSGLLSGTDHGSVSLAGSDLVFTSVNGASARVHATPIPSGAARVAEVGGGASDAALILQGYGGKSWQPWVGQPDGSAAGGPFAGAAGVWRNGAWAPSPSGQVWTGQLTITAKGAYTLTLNEAEGGTWSAARGEWTKTLSAPQFSPTGAVSTGVYQFQGRNEVTTSSDAGSITWRRD